MLIGYARQPKIKRSKRKYQRSKRLGETRFVFDLIDAAKIRDEKDHQLILDWFTTPKFP